MTTTIPDSVRAIRIVKRDGTLIECLTELSVDQARLVIASAGDAASRFERDLADKDYLSPLQEDWLLYLAHQRAFPVPVEPGPFARLLEVLSRMQHGRKSRAELRLPQALRVAFCTYGANTGGAFLAVGPDYAGKVTADGVLVLRNDAPDWLKAALMAVQGDPIGAATEYGRETGRCSVCGRTLTDPLSIQAGIGPVCAERLS